MKMVMMVCASERVESLLDVLERQGVHSFTEIPEAHGAGDTGLHLGTRAFPGNVSLVFSVVRAERVTALKEALVEFSRDCKPSEGLSAFVVNADRLL